MLNKPVRNKAMKNHMIKIFLVLLLFSSMVFADGLLMPVDSSYPDDFLRNKITEVTVNINGLIAETVVYQEFTNEWDQTVDAVYSFPLPPDARSTKLLYTRNDTTFKAVLKVQQQSTNPGTGSGGVAALVNEYIGRNGLKMTLNDIEPGAIQKIELHYISVLKYHQGECSYDYPLDTKDFVKHPIDHLEFNINVQTTHVITAFDIPSHPDFQTLQNESDHIKLRLRKPMSYLGTDLIFKYFVNDNVLDVDFYSNYTDSLDGHFTLLVRPENQVDTSQVLIKNVVLLLGNSSRMVGYKLEQSIDAISQSLDSLDVNDYFNIILFNSTTYNWRSNLVQATSENINAAKTYLDGVIGQFGSRMDLGIQKALQQFQNDNYSNSIIAFTDGYSPLNPKQITSDNNYKTGIFPIGIGDDIDRARLEMTASLNYGFVTYFNEDDNLKDGMVRVIEKINKPLLKNVQLDFNKEDISKLIPQKYPTTFVGTCFFVAGKYNSPGGTTINLTGEGVNGDVQYDYEVNFTDSTEFKAAESIWAKEMIDAIEQEIEIYGETQTLKDSVIDLSLTYNLRCRYTAYIADYLTTDDGWETAITDEEPIFPESHILCNYPNPFNPSTTIRFYLDPFSTGHVKLFKIYNVLGQLVYVVDISHLASGWHEFVYNGQDFLGNSLSGGVYLISLQVDNKIVSTIKVNFLK